MEQLKFTKTMFQKLGATIKVQTNTSILFIFSSCVGFKSRPLTVHPFITRMSMFSLIKYRRWRLRFVMVDGVKQVPGYRDSQISREGEMMR